MNIAFEYLTDLQKAQLLSIRPDLKPSETRCSKCDGMIMDNYGEHQCINCGTEYDDKLQPIRGALLPKYGGRLSKRR